MTTGVAILPPKSPGTAIHRPFGTSNRHSRECRCWCRDDIHVNVVCIAICSIHVNLHADQCRGWISPMSDPRPTSLHTPHPESRASCGAYVRGGMTHRFLPIRERLVDGQTSFVSPVSRTSRAAFDDHGGLPRPVDRFLGGSDRAPVGNDRSHVGAMAGPGCHNTIAVTLCANAVDPAGRCHTGQGVTAVTDDGRSRRRRSRQNVYEIQGKCAVLCVRDQE